MNMYSVLNAKNEFQFVNSYGVLLDDGPTGNNKHVVFQ